MRWLFIVSLALVVLTGCSSGNSKRAKPNELVPLTQKVEVQQRWRASVGSGLSSLYRVMAPVVTKTNVYAADYKGRVFAYEREEGRLSWRQSLGMELAAGVGFGGNQVLLASLNGDVVALAADTGEEQWRVNIASEVLAPPQTNGAVVVVQTNDGRLFGLDAKTGESIWTFTAQLPILTLRGTAAPRVFGPNVLTGFANGKLVALSAVDGTLYWERRIARPQGRSDIERVVDIDGSPTISGQTIFATSYNGTVSALSPGGDILWSQTASSLGAPVVIDNRVFVATAEGWLKAYAADSGLPLWENQLLSGRKLSAPQNLAGFLVVADFEGYVHVFDSETGAILDRFQVDNAGVRSPMVTDGNSVYVLGNDGNLAAISVFLLELEP